MVLLFHCRGGTFPNNGPAHVLPSGLTFRGVNRSEVHDYGVEHLLNSKIENDDSFDKRQIVFSARQCARIFVEVLYKQQLLRVSCRHLLKAGNS